MAMHSTRWHDAIPNADRQVSETRGSIHVLPTANPLAAWALAFGCAVGWGSFVMPGTTFLPVAGPLGTAIAFTIGTLAMLVVALNYGYMARRCPGEGGVYSYARTAFGPNHAFICSWCLVLAYCAAMVSNATALALVLRGVVGPVLQVGFHYVFADYDVYLCEVVSAVVIICIAAWICIRSARLTERVEVVLVSGMALGIVAIIVLMVLDPRVSVHTLEPLYSPRTTPLAGILTVLASVPWAFVGFESVSQISAECDFPPERMTRIMVIAVLCGGVMYVTLNTAASSLIPAGYANWYEYIEALPNLTGIDALPTFHAGRELAGTAGLALFGATALCAVFSGVVGFYVAATRLIHAMALDRALPHRYAVLHPLYNTPAKATMIIMAVTAFIPLFGRNVLMWIIDLMSLCALVAYTYTSLAVFVDARREQKTLMTVVSVLGLALSCICIFLLIVPLPGLNTSLSKESYVILVAWVALGINFYTPSYVRMGLNIHGK